MTKKLHQELVADAYEAGKRAGVIQGLAEAQKTAEQDRRNRILDANTKLARILDVNIKLAQNLGQMVEAVSRAVAAFTSDNNTLRS